MPLHVSVVIPTYNRVDTLPRALRSVQAQSVQNLEMIVVDDGSTDSTRSVVQQIDDPRIRLIQHDTNRGAPAARNTGIRAAENPWVAFLDSDDVWLPDKLEVQCAAIEASPETDIVVTGDTVCQDGTPVKTRFTQPLEGRILDALRRYMVGTTSSILARRRCLTAVDGFDETLSGCQDWDLLLRMASSYRITHLPTPLVRVHRASNRPSISSDTESILQSRLRILEKHRALIQSGGTKALAAHYLQIGKLLCYVGKTKRARQYFRKAMIHHPWKPRLLLHQAASFLGPRAYKTLVDVRQWLAGRWAVFRPDGPHDLGLPGQVDAPAT